MNPIKIKEWTLEDENGVTASGTNGTIKYGPLLGQIFDIHYRGDSMLVRVIGINADGWLECEYVPDDYVNIHEIFKGVFKQ